jgi:hypothetical protein
MRGTFGVVEGEVSTDTRGQGGSAFHAGILCGCDVFAFPIPAVLGRPHKLQRPGVETRGESTHGVIDVASHSIVRLNGRKSLPNVSPPPALISTITARNLRHPDLPEVLIPFV